MPNDDRLPAAGNLAVWLLKDLAEGTPGLKLWLIAEARNLPADPEAARSVVAGRWPALTGEERELAFAMARNVLRDMLEQIEASLERLYSITGEDGHG